MTDEWADKDIPLLGDDPNGSGDGNNNKILKGCFNQFFQFKKKYRKVKILLSIGGWTFSTNLSNGVNTPEKRKNFVNSSLQLLKDLGLDGFDIDWEYPKNSQEAFNYVDLLRLLSEALRNYECEIGAPFRQFELSVAAPAGLDQIKILDLKNMDTYLDFWNLMCYGYSGSWSPCVQYHSNLFGTDPSGEAAIKHYHKLGKIHESKLILGMPAYGVGFGNTNCPGSGSGGSLGPGQSFSGNGGKGSWDYKDLPIAGSQEYVDFKKGSTYCYNNSQRLLITYDNDEISRMKADYVRKKGLGGGMWWDSSTDFSPPNPRSLVGSFTDYLGVCNIDSKQNWLFYPHSQYHNISSGYQHC